MGWLDAFTGKAAKKASTANMGQINAGANKATEALAWGGDNARNQLLNNAVPAVSGNYGSALTALQQYYPEAQGYAGQATAAYDPMIAQGQQGLTAYQTAMGLGPGGSAGALEAFRSTPGYQFALGQGEDSVMRNAAARGMLAGGNTSADLARFGTGIADQTYGSYLSRLNPLMSMYGTGTAGRAAGLTNQAGLASGMGTGTAGVHMGLGQQLAGLYGQAADSYTGEGMARGNLYNQTGRSLGEAQAGGIMGAANAQAGTINAGLNLAGSLFGMPGGTAGTSFGGDLFKRYVQGAVPAQWG